MSAENNMPDFAFPFGQISEHTGQPINGYFSPGMTLRDYFMAHAPSIPWSFAQKSEIRKVQVPAPEAGRNHVKWGTEKWVEDDLAHLVRWRATYADAMLAARKETSK